jgi:hypothetical protein
VLTRGKSTAIFKDVPAQVCDTCGEYYLDEATTSELYEKAQLVFSAGQEIAISSYAVA